MGYLIFKKDKNKVRKIELTLWEMYNTIEFMKSKMFGGDTVCDSDAVLQGLDKLQKNLDEACEEDKQLMVEGE